MTQAKGRPESNPGGHKVLWLIVGPAIVVALVFYLFRLADDGVNVLPEALIGAGAGAALILFLYGNDRPDPNTLAKARWRWGLAAIPIAVVLSGHASVEVIFLSFLGGGTIPSRAVGASRGAVGIGAHVHSPSNSQLCGLVINGARGQE